MNLGAFVLFTSVGAAVWNAVLALLGYLAYRAADPSVIERYSHQLSIIIVVLFAAVVLFFVMRHLLRRSRKS